MGPEGPVVRQVAKPQGRSPCKSGKRAGTPGSACTRGQPGARSQVGRRWSTVAARPAYGVSSGGAATVPLWPGGALQKLWLPQLWGGGLGPLPPEQWEQRAPLSVDKRVKRSAAPSEVSQHIICVVSTQCSSFRVAHLQWQCRRQDCLDPCTRPVPVGGRASAGALAWAPAWTVV